ncbi:hypothetical protein ACPWT1_07760 [Ramlibacter sp. MMS24-I3-19]|uniref:hypothetical protein n=1 Tax=Ramlibacter sp. MMS24-I3-19 TaxID=3416606 RepID=UPI003CFF0152
MKRVIDGRTYNPDTAELIVTRYLSEINKFDWEETGLYRARSGKLFVAGEGGPRSQWREHDELDNSTSGGDGLRVVSREEAAEFMLSAGCSREEIKRALL